MPAGLEYRAFLYVHRLRHAPGPGDCADADGAWHDAVESRQSHRVRASAAKPCANGSSIRRIRADEELALQRAHQPRWLPTRLPIATALDRAAVDDVERT